MNRTIAIEPMTRLEGHGRIDLQLDDGGAVTAARLRVPDFKGFEKFCEGRAVEEMPTLTQKICGVCPTAHHIAASKALDDLYAVTPPPAAELIRELMHTAFIFEDHLLHFYFLGGPDLILGRADRPGQRNIFGVAETLGEPAVARVIGVRKQVRDLIGRIGGSVLYPVIGLPGGVSRPMDAADLAAAEDAAAAALSMAEETMQRYHDTAMKTPQFVSDLRDDALCLRTYSLGMVDADDRVTFYGNRLRVVDPDGGGFDRFRLRDYQRHLGEVVDAGSYMKVLYLKQVGWHGLTDGPQSGIYRVGPLGRLNAAQGLATPKAQAEFERMVDFFGGRPVHNVLAYHWARLVECLYAAERMGQLARNPQILQPPVRHLPETAATEKGIGGCEAPRGTLIHHYQSDTDGILRRMNLIVATQNNAGAIALALERAARYRRAATEADRARLVQRVEMVYRAFDPCLACATH